MKKFWIAAFTTGLLAIGAVAQTPESSSTGNASVTPGQTSASQSAQTSGASANANTSANAQGSNAESLRGATLQAELSKSVDAKKAKPGDEVTARLTQDLKSNGKVVLHKGSKLVGHVTEAQAKTKGNPESRLRIVFDKVIAKGGQEVAFNGVIRAMSAPVEVPATSLGGGNVERTANNGGRGVGPVPMGGATNASPGGGATTRDVGNTAGSIADSAGGAVNNTAGGAMGGATGGVVGMDGISLNANAPGGAGSLISSTSRNVKLDSGTQMLLQVTGSAAAH